MNFTKFFLFTFSVVLMFAACDDSANTAGEITEIKKRDVLPILGNRDVAENGDTIYHKIPDFKFVNQNGDTVTNADLAGKAYVVDFFFISCPTICPKVTQQMLRVHDAFKNNDKLALVAHTIDPKRDDVAALKNYADALEVEAPKWHFVTGEKDDLYEIADDYFSVAVENPDAPGGFDHSGRLILIDENRHVRAFANGTNPDEVTQFIADIETLLTGDGGR